ncbi:MAG: hypothetical protein CL875_03515 [Dehalococcoidales bacterium]|jgi:hypothetical protein|nr:hypothetical protein [Dehalococcoidales bacterium]|tara:strand:- start:559 stop:996 length:438 start_codon:yes stop_codon:yes gene_type:complete
MLIEDIKRIASEIPAELREDKGLFTLECNVGEKKVLITRQRYVYSAKFRIDEKKKEVRFTETLKESAFGISMGADAVESLGFGLKKKGTDQTEARPKEGTVKEPSEPSDKEEIDTIEFSRIRSMIEATTVKTGYTFKYKLTSFGL